MYFSSVRFLKEVKDETSARTKLKNLLVLIARLLALSFLVMAFAQPFRKKKQPKSFAQNMVRIFVDNSYSMNALLRTYLWFQSQTKSRTIVQSYSSEDRFHDPDSWFLGNTSRLVYIRMKRSRWSMKYKIPRRFHKPWTRHLSTWSLLCSKSNGNLHIYLISIFKIDLWFKEPYRFFCQDLPDPLPKHPGEKCYWYRLGLILSSMAQWAHPC